MWNLGTTVTDQEGFDYQEFIFSSVKVWVIIPDKPPRLVEGCGGKNPEGMEEGADESAYSPKITIVTRALLLSMCCVFPEEERPQEPWQSCSQVRLETCSAKGECGGQTMCSQTSGYIIDQRAPLLDIHHHMPTVTMWPTRCSCQG